MRISDWSSDVCSSDLPGLPRRAAHPGRGDRGGRPCRRVQEGARVDHLLTRPIGGRPGIRQLHASLTGALPMCSGHRPEHAACPPLPTPVPSRRLPRPRLPPPATPPTSPHPFPTRTATTPPRVCPP